MRVVLQRASHANVAIADQIVGSIGPGLLVLLGIEDLDCTDDIDWLVRKIVQLRIFADDEGKMNRSLLDVGGEMLVVSQFTLHASTKKGNRPSYIKAARPDKAIPLYEAFVEAIRDQGVHVQTGEFGADMQVTLTNDGPVTIIIDSQDRQ